MTQLRARLVALAHTPAGQQVARFARLGLLAAVSIWLADGHQLTWAAAWGALVGAAEALWRQLAPTVPLSSPHALTYGAWDPPTGIVNPDEGSGRLGSEVPDTPEPPAINPAPAPPA